MRAALPPWLTGDCAGLVHRCSAVANTAVPPAELRHAHALGVRAAEAGVSLAQLVQAMLDAATDHWAGTAGELAQVHARADTLLRVVGELIGSAADGYEHATHDALVRNDRERNEFISDLLTGRADPGRLAERAHRYGIRLPGQHQVIAVRIDTPLPDRAVHLTDEALAHRFGTGNILTTLRDGQLICITAGGLRGVPAELAHQLLKHRKPGTWQIGVGRAHPGVEGLAKSLDEARNTLHLAGRLGFTTSVLNAADLLVFPVLLRDREAITDLVGTVLGPLEQARSGPQPLLDTLAAVFEHQGNHTAAARSLKISVRAITYRLSRIHALTGYNPAEPTQRFTLHAAVLGARLLDWPHQPFNG